MVQAWLMDTIPGDQRLPHRREPNVDVSLNDLEKLGVLSFKVDADNYASDPQYTKIKEGRGYNYEDEVICSPERLQSYDEKLKAFFTEHIHEDEEVRFILDGTGYFDVRNKDDEWIRIHTQKGDLIIIPAGIYHRFTMDEKNFIQAKRLFRGVPVWTPINRPADEHPTRVQYLNSFGDK